jgi:hypothetical protein
VTTRIGVIGCGVMGADHARLRAVASPRTLLFAGRATPRHRWRARGPFPNIIDSGNSSINKCDCDNIKFYIND